MWDDTNTFQKPRRPLSLTPCFSGVSERTPTTKTVLTGFKSTAWGHNSYAAEDACVWSPGFSRSDEVSSWISQDIEPPATGYTLPAKAGTPCAGATESHAGCSGYALMRSL